MHKQIIFLSDIIQKGVFEIKDNSNSEILMNNKEIKSVDVQKNEAYQEQHLYI